jgi:hypothetical protein
VNVGEIYRVDGFYLDPTTGESRSKYLTLLATTAGGDFVARLLTSKHPGIRPEQPPCHHGNPYPGFYLGVLGEPLGAKSWLDLRALEDVDGDQFSISLRKGTATLISTVPADLLRPMLECAAGALDTTRNQERCIRDTLASIPPS